MAEADENAAGPTDLTPASISAAMQEVDDVAAVHLEQLSTVDQIQGVAAVLAPPNRPRTTILDLANETRQQIYRSLFRGMCMSMDVKDDKGKKTYVVDKPWVRRIMEVLLACRTFYLEVPFILAQTIRVTLGDIHQGETTMPKTLTLNCLPFIQNLQLGSLSEHLNTDIFPRLVTLDLDLPLEDLNDPWVESPRITEMVDPDNVPQFTEIVPYLRGDFDKDHIDNWMRELHKTSQHLTGPAPVLRRHNDQDEFRRGRWLWRRLCLMERKFTLTTTMHVEHSLIIKYERHSSYMSVSLDIRFDMDQHKVLARHLYETSECEEDGPVHFGSIGLEIVTWPVGPRPDFSVDDDPEGYLHARFPVWPRVEDDPVDLWAVG